LASAGILKQKRTNWVFSTRGRPGRSERIHTFFDKMANEEGSVKSASFFRTHPPFLERILSTFSEIEARNCVWIRAPSRM
jgi:hypothetical protein